MDINVICTDTSGWIYARFLRELKKHSKHNIFLNSKNKCSIIHCLPYYDLPKHPSHPCTIWSSHQELKNPLKDRFISAAKQADYCLCHAQKYVELLKANGIQHAIQVMPGIDFDLYRPRSINRPKSDKLVVGYIGRSYVSTSRKNEGLLKKISKLPFIDLRVSGGKIKELEMPRFYDACDLIVQTSLVEGGSMAHLEATSMGIPFLCYDDVGTSREWDYGTIRVTFNNESAFVTRLEEFWKNKEYEEYRKPESIQKTRAQVESFTWKNFVLGLERVWESLI